MFSYNIIKLDNVNSTNRYALSLKKNVFFKEGLVITANSQSNGEGQRGSKWESETSKNLLISVVIEPKLKIFKQFDLVKIVSLGITDFLSENLIKSYIKWPNDIIINKKKLAGILINNVISSDNITHSVIGIGMNINQLFFKDYSIKATSLGLLLKKKLSIDDVKLKLLDAIFKRLQSYRANKDLHDDYIKCLFRHEKISTFKLKNNIIKGKITGVNDDGLLIITFKKQIKEFNLKEIQMIL